MEIFFGLLAIALLIWGLRSQKKQKKEWVKEERYDESGAWLDKRTGERGTYGSLDSEMEQDRKIQSNRLKTNELASVFRSYCFEEYPGFATLGDAETKACLAFIKVQAAALVAVIEKITAGQGSDSPSEPVSTEIHSLALKKRALDFSFDNFPKLLDLEIEMIKKFDLVAGCIAADITAEVERQKILFSTPPPASPVGKI